MTERIGYQGPPRIAEDVIAAALADEESMRQLRNAFEEERLGIPPVPLRQIQAELRDKEARQRRSA
jgi:hypothetical protein